MRDYEELVKELRDCRNMAAYSEFWWDITTKAADVIEELSRQIEQLQYQPLPGWISVEERLPDMKDTDWVIGVVNGYSKNIKYVDAVVMVSYDPTDGGWFLENDDLEASITVTHWMPLPEPPEENTDA